MKNILKKTFFIKTIVQLFLTVYLIYSVVSSILIDNNIKIAVTAFFIVLFVVSFFVEKKILKKKPPLIIVTYILILLLFLGVSYGVSIFAGVDKVINNITSDKYMDVNSNFVALKKSKINSIDDLEGKKVGLLSNKNDYEGYILPTEALDKKKIESKITYKLTFLELINGLIDGDFDAIVLPNDYKDRFDYSEDVIAQFENFVSIHKMSDKIKIVVQKEKEIAAGKPFNIVLIGTDSPLETHHHNYDVIILLTFNPETKDLAVTSVYRATGMYSKCIGGFDLVTHNGWKGWGSDCLKQTVEDFFDIDISYYLMIDFNGFVDMVDTIGGIDVTVIKDFCEQNSERKWGDNTICLKAGPQHLNGEQALAFARHRMSYKGEGGIIRSQNHITIIKAIAKKIISSNNLFKFNKILEILQENMETDMTKDQLSNLFDTGMGVVKDINYDIDKINIIPLSMTGYGEMLYSPAMHTVVGLSLIYEKSYYNIYNALHTIIDYKPKNPTYFSIDLSKDPAAIPEVYLPGIREKAVDPRIMPNLVGKTDYEVTTWARQYLYLQVIRKYESSNTIPKGNIINQSIPAGAGMNHNFKITFTISLGSNETAINLPNTSGWDYNDVSSFISSKKLNNYDIIKYSPTSSENYSHNDFVKFDSTTAKNEYIYPSSKVTFYIASIPSEVDDIPPTITLKGNATVNLSLGDTYTEPGYTAWDEIDWYITNKVTKTNNIDTNTPGTYAVTYSVTNSNGLKTTKERTIIVS